MILLPFPPSSLSGHNDGNRWAKAPVVARHREWARYATLEADLGSFPGDDDIKIIVTFVPPDRRGDRINFPNRMKPYFDGIADALGVNDKRFVPEFRFAAPEKPGRVEVVL